MWRGRHCGVCSWTAVLLLYTVSVHVQDVQSQSTAIGLPVTPSPSTPNPPTASTVSDVPSTVTNGSSSTVVLVTSGFAETTPDRTTATPHIPTTTPESPTPAPTTNPQLITTSHGLPTTRPQITTTTAQTTTPQITTTDAATTTPQRTATDAQTAIPQRTTTDFPTTTPQPSTTPELPTPVPTTSPGLPTIPPQIVTTDVPTITPQITTTDEPTITPQLTTTDLPTTITQHTTTNIPITTPQITTTNFTTTTPQPTTTDVPTITPQITTAAIPTTIPQLTTTDAPTTTTPQLATTDAPTTMPQLTTTNESTTTPQITTTDLPTTMPQPTYTDVPATTPQPTTTGALTTETQITTTDLPTTTPQLTTTDSPTTPQLTTTYLPTIAPQITTTVLQTTTPQTTTTNALVQTPQIATTGVLTITPQITTDVSTTTLEITTPVPSASTTTTTPLIIAVSPNVPEPTTNNPTVQITTPVPPTTTPATTPERTTTAPTTTPEAPTTTPDIPTTGPPLITTTQEVTTPTLPVPTTTPELPTTTPYSPTTIPQIVTTTPDLPTTPQITTTTTDFPTTTTEITTPIPPIPTTTPELPTTVPFPTTTPEVTTTTTDFSTTAPEITTPIPVIPTTTPEPPTTTTQQIITTSTDLPTTNAPIPTTAPKAPTTGPESPITSPPIASSVGPVVVVSPVENTDVTTPGLGTDTTTAAPQDVDLWMPIVAGVGASMVVLIIVIIIIACVTCCNRPVQLDEKYLTDEEEMLPLGQTNGTPGRAPREKLLDRPDRNSVPRKKTGTKPKNAERYRVKESYRSEAEDQISLVKGEEVEVINKPTDDWWFGRSQQKIGWFPTKHLQVAGTENPSFVHDEESSLPDPPPSLQTTFLPNGTAGSDATLPIRATGETSDDVQRRASLSNLSLPPPPPELLAHEDETTPPARSVDNISIGSVSTSASLRNMPDISENTQTTPPNGRSDSPVSLASTAQESVSSSRPPSRASRTPSTLGSPNIPWMGSVGRSHVRTHPHAKAVLRTGQPDTAEESRMHLIMNTNLPDREASMRSNRSGRSSEDRTGRDRKLSMALRLSEPESALELDLPPPPPEFDSPKASDPSPHTERYIAVYGYRATDENQLNLEEDDVITVIERDPLGWARGICLQTGKEGWFPESYVKRLGEDTKRPAPKPPTDKTKRAEAPDQSVQSGQDTLSRPRELRPRPSVRKSLMNKQPSAKGPSEVFYSPSDADDGPGRPTVAVRPSSHEQPAPRHQNRGTFGAPPPIQSEKSPTYSTSERKPSMRGSVQGSVQDTGPSTVPVKPPRQPSQRHSVAISPKPPTIVRSPSRRVSMPINFDMLEESSIDDTPSQVSNKSRRPPNLSLGSFPPQTQQEVGSTGSLSRSRPSRSSVTAAPDIMKTLEELDLQDTQLRTAIETFTMRGPGYLNFNKGDVILELEESDIPGWSYGELQDGTRGIFPVSSTENAATFV
uniref:SH3 domain-containing protein n=1 Tax=Branchiostoma floridae TaxID=7739 RepID=C3YZB4_BRAFL|eukprot:XP_002598173.1 hypothetical protein BRAFLDRAFT_69500 [Branchiostoma floridae]